MTTLRLSALVMIACTVIAPAAHAQAFNLQRLHDSLNLSPAQEQAWQAFQAASAQDPMEAARQRNAAQLMSTLSAPRRVDLSIAVMRADLQTLERRGAALKAFYATLSPQQQVVFDRQTAPQARQ